MLHGHQTRLRVTALWIKNYEPRGPDLLDDCIDYTAAVGDMLGKQALGVTKLYKDAVAVAADVADCADAACTKLLRWLGSLCLHNKRCCLCLCNRGGLF